MLARILDDVRDRRPAENPARGVKLPVRARRKNVHLSADQLHALAVAAGRYRSLVLLLRTAGLRWGEAAALRVRDVDFLKRRIVLHENAVSVGSKVHVGTLKSGKHRTIALARFVVDELAKTCAGKDRDELLWPARSGGYLGPPSSHDSWLSGAVDRCRKADKAFPMITAHALPHTAASLAISSGAYVQVVQRMLDHASAAMTLDVYADLLDDDSLQLPRNWMKLWAKCGHGSRARPSSKHKKAFTSANAATALEPPVRIELTTARLQGECSTTELRRPVKPVQA
ncbi:hypothetical protein MLAC_00760 [Mycobacterium lacus]|uniref:Tyr recombinase domain-containing protein n=1 Tax=Mycobacterium lacus TaxID=169765 RepID=A0A7I7NDL4_9MYCO|nr:hypothetical protein MLAC_00760 [Mycobacterium lacus]